MQNLLPCGQNEHSARTITGAVTGLQPSRLSFVTRQGESKKRNRLSVGARASAGSYRHLPPFEGKAAMKSLLIAALAATGVATCACGSLGGAAAPQVTGPAPRPRSARRR